MHHIMIDTSQKDEKQALQDVLNQLQEKGEWCASGMGMSK
jgi:hypothetical protein